VNGHLLTAGPLEPERRTAGDTVTVAFTAPGISSAGRAEHVPGSRLGRCQVMALAQPLTPSGDPAGAPGAEARSLGPYWRGVPDED
jgi:hypothetical protein